MNVVSTTFYFKIFVLFFCFAISAKSEPSKTLVSVNMSMIVMDGSSVGLVSPIDPEEMMFVGSNAFTPYISYKGSSHLLFYPHSSDSQFTEQKPLAFVDIPQDANDVLLLFVKQQSDSGFPYKVFVIEEQKEALLPGVVKVFNFTSTSLAIKLEKEKFIVKSGDSHMINGLSGNGLKQFAKIAKVEADEVHLLHSSFWNLESDSRLLVIITDHPRFRGDIYLRKIRQPI